MSAARLPFRVLVITDEDACRARARGVVETIARALLPRADGAAVLVRAKRRDVEHVRRLCAALRPITRKAGARLLVHSHPALVRELDLDGAHVDARASLRAARHDLDRVEGALLGASRHDDDALDDAALAGADYVTLSPIFAPVSKRDARAPLGVRALRRASARPIVALGGVDETRAAACLREGAAAVAVIGAVMGAHDPRRALVALLS